MSIFCKLFQNNLIDYLDGALDERSRHRFMLHLKNCSSCRAALALHEEWLSRRDLLQQHKALEGKAAADLTGRILTAVQKSEYSFKKEKAPSGFRLSRWPGLAGAAVAIIILVTLFQGSPALQPLFGGRELIEDYTVNQFATTSKSGTNEIITSPAAVDSNGNWLILSIKDEKSLTVLNGESALPQQDAMRLMEFNEPCILRVLSLADNARAAVQYSPSARVVLLVPAHSDDRERMINQVKDALAPCETPFRIEIINADKLAGRLDSLDELLPGLIDVSSEADLHWILVLIGE